MKRSMFVVAGFMAIIFLCSTAYCESGNLLEGMGKKLFRGVANVLTGWIELPAQTIKGYKRGCPLNEDNKVMGVFCGLFKGIGHTIGRTAWGAVEVVGFWAANPEDNIGIGIPLDAEYAWEEGTPHDCIDPTFEEATLQPIFKKFMRGLGNGLFGFAEFPGQIAKGLENKAPDLGIVKGLWFWYSREVYGIADVATAIFPTPDEHPGYVFDEEYPWDAIVNVIEE